MSEFIIKDSALSVTHHLSCAQYEGALLLLGKVGGGMLGKGTMT